MNFGNMAGLMKQAQQMKAKMLKMQAELAVREYSAESGGGMVKAVALGDGTLKSLKIDANLLKDDVEIVEDLIVTAVRDAVQKGKADVQAEMAKIMPPGMGGGGGIPGLF